MVSRRLERTVITAPIIFTAVVLLIFLMPLWLSALEVTREAFLRLLRRALISRTALPTPSQVQRHLSVAYWTKVQ
jgi:hypothetical protein